MAWMRNVVTMNTDVKKQDKMYGVMVDRTLRNNFLISVRKTKYKSGASYIRECMEKLVETVESGDYDADV